MTIARRRQVCLDVTPYYHCVTRCVRRAYLCGFDRLSGLNFDHRRGWIEKRLALLSKAFCIDIAGYAIMSNHYHVVVKVDQEKACSLTRDEVIACWRRLYKGPSVLQRYVANEQLDAKELEELDIHVSLWREQLVNISRFMGNLNEHIARMSNKEDGCKGRFWESRFKLQAILDDEALLRTLCYVDLNPVRAGVAKTPESSAYTSFKRRLTHRDHELLPFEIESTIQADATSNKANFKKRVLPIRFSTYMELLDWVGRITIQGKRGSIHLEAPAIAVRLGYSMNHWIKTHSDGSWFQRALGSSELITRYCEAIGQRWIWQVAASSQSEHN